MLGTHHVVGFVVLLKSHLSLIFKMKRHHITGDSVYETLCPQHMLAPNNSLEMVPNLQRDIPPEKKDGFCSKVNLGGHALSADQVLSP